MTRRELLIVAAVLAVLGLIAAVASPAQRNAVLLVVTGRGSLYSVPSSSMVPTLPVGSRALGVALSPDTDNEAIARGRIVIFTVQGRDGASMKRIVAISGDRVIVDPYGTVAVHVGDDAGAAVVHCPEGEGRATSVDRVLAPGEFFMLGDNCWRSNDSRHSDFGIVSARQIEAVVVYRVLDWFTVEPVGQPRETTP